ncbi:MAG: deoxyribodipyrimidine photolyase [Pirellulales bacterium]
MTTSAIPPLRIRVLHDFPLKRTGEFVVYWMIAQRRTTGNFALQRACELAAQAQRPLVVFEPLRCNYPWASDRLHRFVIDGMLDNAARLADTPAHYFPYLEPAPGAATGLLAALAQRACAVVTDEFPCFFLPALIRAAARHLDVRLEVVDSNGLLPLRAAEREFTMAHSFRRFLQKELRPHLNAFPVADPLADCRLPRLAHWPREIERRWPAAPLTQLAAHGSSVAHLPLDHSVPAVDQRGGAVAAAEVLTTFLRQRLSRYAAERNEPERDVASGLSPYLHFGHIGAHQIFTAVTQRDGWTPRRLTVAAHGKAQGWWQASEEVESFLEELVTWREIGYNLCWRRRDYDRWSSLPEWARNTLQEHARDRREAVYSLDEFESARTHDPLWNAAQRQLVREGRIHNYLRMLWGKKILEWTSHPQEALSIMIQLNNKYALDGRNPNSYCGIGWVLGRFDRAWGPVRPVYGTVRYMSSANTARKVNVRGYLARYGAED